MEPEEVANHSSGLELEVMQRQIDSLYDFTALQITLNESAHKWRVTVEKTVRTLIFVQFVQAIIIALMIL